MPLASRNLRFLFSLCLSGWEKDTRTFSALNIISVVGQLVFMGHNLVDAYSIQPEIVFYWNWFKVIGILKSFAQCLCPYSLNKGYLWSSTHNLMPKAKTRSVTLRQEMFMRNHNSWCLRHLYVTKAFYKQDKHKACLIRRAKR